MEVYFVRHGETTGNRSHRHQPNKTPLTARGKQQAEVVADRVVAVQPTHIISSSYVRALQTAQVAGDRLDIIPETSPLFTELERPKTLFGYHHFSPRSVWYMIKWYLGREEYHDEGRGESYLAFITRLKAARSYIESLPPDATVVVFSHSIFINFFVQHICSDKPLPVWHSMLLFLKIKALDNSSITHMRCNPSYAENVCKWEVVAFDDDAHIKT